MRSGKERISSKSKGTFNDDNKLGTKSKDKGIVPDRDSWWKGSLRDSPNPGTYHIRGFIEEADLNPVRMTYGFLSVGRKRPVHCVCRGDFLLPGAYELTDCIQEALKRPASYSFKSCPRLQNDTLGIRDKHINLSPCHYDVTKKPIPKLPSSHVMFRSAVKRSSFPPKEGPAPGQYNLRKDPPHSITSCFRSSVPRFHSVRSITPGPGTYEPSLQIGQRLPAEATLGRTYGVFFRNIY